MRTGLAVVTDRMTARATARAHQPPGRSGRRPGPGPARGTADAGYGNGRRAGSHRPGHDGRALTARDFSLLLVTAVNMPAAGPCCETQKKQMGHCFHISE